MNNLKITTTEEVDNIHKDIQKLLDKYWMEQYWYAVYVRQEQWKQYIWWIKIDLYEDEFSEPFSL